MDRKIRLTAALVASAALLSGCSMLLERSSSVVEPYTDRYWESNAEDTLRAENHQDLVNTLLLLVEEGAQEGVIRCYTEQNAYFLGYTASQEVKRETVEGAYLLEDLDFTYELGDGYCTLFYQMTYREDAESLDGLMRLSDCQSLVDLLRVALREEHQKLTARFVYKTPRDEILAAVEGLWQELYRESLPQPEPPAEEVLAEPPAEDLAEDPAEAGPEEVPAEQDPADGPAEAAEEPREPQEPPAEGGDPHQPGEDSPDQPVEPEIQYPPCPWTVNLYPNRGTAGIVEILLNNGGEG